MPATTGVRIWTARFGRPGGKDILWAGTMPLNQRGLGVPSGALALSHFSEHLVWVALNEKSHNHGTSWTSGR